METKSIQLSLKRLTILSGIKIFLVVHLAIVFLSVTHVFNFFDETSIVTRSINIYSRYSYANWKFGFFAPEVTEDFYIKFILNPNTNQQDTLYDFNYRNHEMNNRLYGLKAYSQVDTNTTHLFAKSWGLKILNTYPAVSEVYVELYKSVIPDAQQVAISHTPLKWNKIYETNISIK